MHTKQFRTLILASAAILSITSCSTVETQSSNSSSNTSSAPSTPLPQSGIETVAILGTNDLHGSLAAHTLKTRETGGKTPVAYEAGGVAVLASYINILRHEFGNHFIWLDAGDEFQGSIESNTDQGAPMVSFFNAMGLNAAAIGNHEFDFGIPALRARMKEAHYPYLAANITDKGSGKLTTFPNTYPSKIIQAGNLRIGIIGLSTLETPTSTHPENVKNYVFEDLKSSTLTQAAALRKQGAQIILITSHAGLHCDLTRTPSVRVVRKPTDIQGECHEQDEIVQLLRSLPTGTVDGLVAGHTHEIVHHWIGEVPVIEGGAHSRYTNVLYLTYDWSQKALVTDETRIEGPIPICEKVFENQSDCNGDRPAPKNGRGDLVPVKFHGTLVKADSKITELVEPVIKKSEATKMRVLGTAARPIEHYRDKESELGDLVADAIRLNADADFSYVNPGGIRQSLEPGPITYGEIFAAFPFDNSIVKVQMTAQELHLFLRVAESGARGFGSVSGLQLKLLDLSVPAPFDDLNGDGKTVVWEANRLLGMALANGRVLDPKQLFTLATMDFLVAGGDDLGWPMSKIPPEHIHPTGVLLRDAVVQYIERNQTFNSEQAPLIDKAHPRIILQKVYTAPKKSKKGRRRKH
jgi:5'-nucleotidase